MKRIHRGDDGYTDIIGSRLPKDSPIIEFIGEVDELVSITGVVKSVLRESGLPPTITNNLTCIQRTLTNIASYVAKGGAHRAATPITHSDIIALENSIDRLWTALTPSRFVIPGSSKESALIHLLRAICRRVERRAATLLRNGIIDPVVYIYLNRLSDWLYVIALHINKVRNIEEDYL
ncbi:MAG: cob(I)yrinic acid a,c-diamide adenosyltransferase [Ignisphaera sp.]|nr:cob(I)yrinic acid a,c-diamide adenosyltransferase [Ignisphaera sp.]MCX8167479.1 cob(I)yrinic acid a,c-diamide adenosyltransferase [Ignisphaera sp.]MDW8084657.1 cob(I)yrinic acid a,c-diamide adenosyltransferase [Ignisphaera sp.]